MNFVWVLIVLCLIIGFHEFGHFVVARACGVGVPVFSIGFGPVLLSKKIGETDFRISAIPLGGYVQMVDNKTCGNSPEKSMQSKSYWQQILICLAGPSFNILLCLLVLTFGFAIYGSYDPSPRIGEVMSDSPAFQGGLQAQDVIVSINGKLVKKWADIPRFINKGKNQVAVLRNGEYLLLEVGTITIQGREFFGINPSHQTGIKNAVITGVNFTYDRTKLIVVSIKNIFTGKIKFNQAIGGPIQLVQVGGQAKESGGFFGILFYVSIISLGLGILNLLPIPPMDGGQIALLAYPALTGHTINPTVEKVIRMTGFYLLILLMAFAIYSDISKIFRGK